MFDELDKLEAFWEKRGWFKDEPTRLLHACDKREDMIFAARTKAEVLDAARCIVWLRMEYWYPRERQEIPPPPIEEGTVIPEALKKEAEAKLRNWRQRNEWREKDNEIYDLVQIVKNDHYLNYARLAALRIIELRQDHEYEYWYFENFVDTEKNIEAMKKKMEKKTTKKAA